MNWLKNCHWTFLKHLLPFGHLILVKILMNIIGMKVANIDYHLRFSQSCFARRFIEIVYAYLGESSPWIAHMVPMHIRFKNGILIEFRMSEA